MANTYDIAAEKESLEELARQYRFLRSLSGWMCASNYHENGIDIQISTWAFDDSHLRKIKESGFRSRFLLQLIDISQSRLKHCVMNSQDCKIVLDHGVIAIEWLKDGVTEKLQDAVRVL